MGVGLGAAEAMRWGVLLAAVGVCAFASIASAHPYHVSMSEATVNHDEQRLEVAMRAFPEDLEAALTRKFSRDVDLERTEDIDALLTAYLKSVFSLRDPDASGEDEQAAGGAASDSGASEESSEAPAPPRFLLTWVGKEIEPRDVWLYFTIALDREIEGLELRNTAMFGVEATQENIVVLTDGARRVTLKCDHARPKVVVDFTLPEESSDN